jgi:hypothetical protein
MPVSLRKPDDFDPLRAAAFASASSKAASGDFVRSACSR